MSEKTGFIIGLGGVGSWAAEILARSSIGKLYVMDMDRIEESNLNRQMQTLPDNLGEFKSDVMKKRLSSLGGSEIISISGFVDDKFLEKIDVKPDFVVDAIDHITAKCSILNWATKNNIYIASSMGAANRLHPEMIRTQDLSQATVCPMAKDVRRHLRRKYGFPMEGDFGIPSVFSIESPIQPEIDGIKGSLAQVTAAFGAALASLVINKLSFPEKKD